MKPTTHRQQQRSPKMGTAAYYPPAFMAAPAAGLFGLLPAGAQETSATNLAQLKALNLEQLLEVKVDTVYAASKREQRLADAPASVSVVRAEDIQQYGFRTPGEILNSLPGFYVTSERIYNSLGARGFNRPGDYGGRTLLLLDGQIHDFWLMNVTLFSQKIVTGLEFSVSVNNLLDQDYAFPGTPNFSQAEIPQLDRSLWFKLTYKF